MATIIPPGFGLMTLNLKHESAIRSWAVTIGLDISDAGGAWEDALIEASSAFRVTSGVMSFMDTNVKLTTATLKVGSDGGDGPLVEFTYNEPGGRSGSAAPANLATLVRKVTASGGRRGRGRFYWPALVMDGEVDELGLLSSTLVDDLQGAFNLAHASLMSGLGGSPIPTPPVVLHDSEGAGIEPVPTPITSFSVQQLAGTQRRRMRR